MPLATFRLLVAASISLCAASASAQLKLRLDPEVDDPGTNAMPARFGYGRSAKGSGAAMQLALTYSIVKSTLGDNVIYEPYVAVIVNDNESTGTDKKAAEFGVMSVIGDVTKGAAWLTSANLARARDRIAGTSSLEAKLTGEPVHRALKMGQGYVAGRWGLFVRPQFGAYYLKTLATDDPATAPKGATSGVSIDLSLDLFPSFSDRTKVTVTSGYAKDLSASGDREKDTYTKHKAQVEYAFYNAADPPKGGALLSLVVVRSIGRDALTTSTDKKASTGAYIGVKF